MNFFRFRCTVAPLLHKVALSSAMEEFARDFIDNNSALKSWLGACTM